MSDSLTPDSSPSTGAVNPPQIDPQTLIPKMRAVKDAAQCWQLVKAYEEENRERNRKNARIQDKANSERPFSQEQLDAEGLGWKSNFSTKPLPHLIDKIAPRFTSAVKSMRYLTSSRLPDNVPGASAKSEAFQAEITKVCRQREGWNDLLAEVAQENALFGFTSVAWLDEFSWFPKHFRGDSFYVPRGTKHFAGSAQIYISKDEWLLHELFSFVEDPQSAEIAGWDVENTVEAINAATPEAIRSRFSDYERVYSDLQRELSLAHSFVNGARAVLVYHVLATEITGKVSHFIIEGREGKELFQKLDRFDSMADACAFFSFQHGNGKLHGSKGIGREVYNMAAALDRSRNDIVDRLQMAGKVLFTCDEKQIKRFRMSVMGNAILVSEEFQAQQAKIDGDVEPFLKLDSFFTDLLDQIAGSSSPKALEGDRVTKAAVELYASRDEERRDAVIERFLSQFTKMMSTIQRRLCDPRSTETDAVAMQKRLIQVLTPDELTFLANQPAAETVADFSDMERQQIILVAQEARGNPLYNQKEVERRKLTAQVSSEFADAVLLPDNDPTETAEQSRGQQLENVLLAHGQKVPVSPRDNFLVHIGELEPLVVASAAHCVDQGANAIAPYGAAVQHAYDHLQLALQGGADKQKIGPYIQKIQGWVRDFQNFQAHEAQVQAAAQQQAALQQGAGAAPAQLPAPGAAPADDAAPQQPSNITPFPSQQ